MINDPSVLWRRFGHLALLAIGAGLLTGVVAGGVAFVVSQTVPKQYVAEAGVIVGSLTATSTDELSAYQSLAMTYAELATSTPLLTRVIDDIGLDDDPVSLGATLDVRTPGQGIILIDATSRSPSTAAEVANAVAAEVLKLSQPTGAATATATPSPRPTEPSPRPSEASPTPSEPVASATASTASLAAIFQPALPPDHPSSPLVFLNVLIASLLGFVLGGGAVALILARRGDVTGWTS